MKLTPDALSTRGEGIARIDGKAVFVPFTLPGETWEAELVEQKKKYDRALPVRLLSEPEEDSIRVEPACPYYGSCGGCQIQHIDYSRQLMLKRDWLSETFRRIAHLDIDPKPTVESPPWEYRNKLTVPLHVRDGVIAYGFHHVYRPDQLVAIDDCHIADPRIRGVMPGVLKALNESKPEIHPPSAKKTPASKIVFRVIDKKVFVQFSGLRFTPPQLEILLGSLENNESQLDEFIVSDTRNQPTHFKLDDSEKASSFHPNAFLQINDTIREKIYDAVLTLPYQKHEKVLDGYCGVGRLTQRLTERFQSVVGIESGRASSEEALEAVKLAGLEERVRIYREKLESYLARCEERFDAVILNPPRSGLSPKARQQIVQHHPEEIAIVSCHPAALARDVKTLVDAGYRIQFVQPFDMFPQTYHLEALIYLRNTRV